MLTMNLQLFASNFINVDKLYYAVMTSQDISPLPTYSAPKPLMPAAKINVDPNTNKVPYYADGAQQEMAQITADGKVTLQGSVLSLAVQADIFGHVLDGTGGITYNKNDVAPFVAIFYRREKANHKFRYMKMYKCLFSDPKDAAETSNTTVKPQDDTIEGVFFSRISDGNWKKIIDEETAGYVDVSSTFFNQVDGAVDVVAPTVLSTVPAANATAVAVGAPFVWTMSESLNPSTVIANNFYLIKDSDGSIVGATVVYNDAAKTVTLTPTVALSAASKYLAIVDTDVVDITGNHMVAITKIFTTA